MNDLSRLICIGLCITTTAIFSKNAVAADQAAGADLALQCAACHGSAGVGTGKGFPNLAAQKEDYLAKQLRAFKNGDRKNALMNAIAASLSDEDIDNLASHFSSLAGAKSGEIASNDSGLDGKSPIFPEDYQQKFTRYHRIDFENRKQVRFYSANEAALASAKSGSDFGEGAYLLVEIYAAKADADGQLVRTSDSSLEPAERTGFTAMEKRSGTADSVPDLLKNGDWRYAVFTVDGSHREGLNEGSCLACHKPLASTDYVFTTEILRTFAQKQ